MSMTKEDAVRVVESVKHPAIDLSLVELGMIRNINVEKDTVIMEFVFPFPNIPVKEMLFASVRTPLENMGFPVSFTEALMTQEEVQRFLSLEAANWKG